MREDRVLYIVGAPTFYAMPEPTAGGKEKYKSPHHAVLEQFVVDTELVVYCYDDGDHDIREEPLYRLYPSCTRHGAMNRVIPERSWWRCLACGLGVEWDGRVPPGDITTVLHVVGYPDSIGFTGWPALVERDA